jgi:hypothetical protein
MVCTLTKFYSSGKIKEDDVGGVSGTNGGEEKYIQRFVGETLKGICHSEYLAVDGRIILI